MFSVCFDHSEMNQLPSPLHFSLFYIMAVLFYICLNTFDYRHNKNIDMKVSPGVIHSTIQEQTCLVPVHTHTTTLFIMQGTDLSCHSILNVTCKMTMIASHS